MINSNKYKTFDPEQFKQKRPDLWELFTQSLKDHAPDFLELINNNENVIFLKENYGAKLLIEINDLPERTQFIIKKAIKQAAHRNTALMMPHKLKTNRPDLWETFIEILKENDPALYEQAISDNIETQKWFVDDLPGKAQTIVVRATLDAQSKLKQ